MWTLNVEVLGNDDNSDAMELMVLVEVQWLSQNLIGNAPL